MFPSVSSMITRWATAEMAPKLFRLGLQGTVVFFPLVYPLLTLAAQAQYRVPWRQPGTLGPALKEPMEETTASPRQALLGPGTQSCSLATAPNTDSLCWQDQCTCPRPGLSSVPRELPVRLASTQRCISLPLSPSPASGPLSQEAEGPRRARMAGGEGREKRSKPKGEAS